MRSLVNSKYHFSFYKNLYNAKASETVININELIEIIKFGYLKNEIEKLRAARNKEVYNKMKVSALPAVTLSGLFSERNSKGLQKHSGLMQIDLDDIKDYKSVLTNIRLDSYTYVAFQSPGGKGIKVIVKINPDVSTHLEQFYALEEYYKKEFNVPIDPSCKDVARCLLLSYDPDIFCNPFSDVFEECFISEQKKVKYVTNDSSKINIYLSNKENPLKELTEAIEKERIDITNTYENWIKVGYAISESMGGNGREYFHRISQFHPEYKQEATDKLYNNLSIRNNGSITMGTLFFLAKERGIFVNFKNETDLASMAAEPASAYGNDLYQKLKKFRQRKSQEKEMSLFYIYNNVTLEELVKARPKNIKELEKIKGIGKKKIEWFGKELLEEIQLDG